MARQRIQIRYTGYNLAQCFGLGLYYGKDGTISIPESEFDCVAGNVKEFIKRNTNYVMVYESGCFFIIDKADVAGIY